MSRGIKFRAWDGKRMVTPYCITGEDGRWFNDHRNFVYWISHHGPLMQFTGLADRNGVEIYEGDYTKDIGGNVGVIEWSQEECGWLWINEYEAQCPFGECEVIGNIYEHPHLLEGE